MTIDDMLDVAEEEATEDIQKFGGMEAMDEPYMRIPLGAWCGNAPPGWSSFSSAKC